MEDNKKKTQQETNTFDTRWNLVLTLNRVHSISPPCVFIDQCGKSRMFNLFDHLMGTVKFLGGANKWNLSLPLEDSKDFLGVLTSALN